MHQGFPIPKSVQCYWVADSIKLLILAIKIGATAIMTATDFLSPLVHSHLMGFGIAAPRDVSLT
jgi:hypothetical protein